MLDVADSAFYLAQSGSIRTSCRHQTIVARLKICLDLGASKVNTRNPGCFYSTAIDWDSDSESSRHSVIGMDTRGLSRLLLLPPLLLSSSFSSSSSLLLPPSSPHLLRPSTPFFSSLLLLARAPHGAQGDPRADAEAHLLSNPSSNLLDSKNPPASK